MERAVQELELQSDFQTEAQIGVLTEEEERKLEEAADALLAKTRASQETPIYTELQLARRGRRKRVTPTNVEALMENAPAPAPQDFFEELKFLMSVTELKRVERCLLRGWMAGWSQRQIRSAFPEAGTYSQQHLSRMLREAILKCYSSGLSFEHFSQHTIYRKPARRREDTRR